MTLHVAVITPQQPVYADDVDEIVVPTQSGQLTILPEHIALLTPITPGEMIIKKDGKEELMAITGGFLEVGENTVTILADYAVRGSNIQVAKAQEAKKRAEKAMAEKATDRDFAEAEAQLRRSLLELKVADKLKKRSI